MRAPFELTQWLSWVIDELEIHDRSAWAAVLGVSEQTIAGWLSEAMITSDKLCSILVLLRERHAHVSAGALADWPRISKVKVEVDGRRIPLARYALLSRLADLKIALEAPPSDEMEPLIEMLIQTVNVRRLGRSPVKYPERLWQALASAQRLDEDVGYEPPIAVPCLRCGSGEFFYTGLNTQQTLAFLECLECGFCFTVGHAADFDKRRVPYQARARARSQVKGDVSLDTLRDVLALVDREASIEQLKAWTAEERRDADAWACATHLAASDNDVEVPQEPLCVADLKLRYDK